MDSEQHLPSWDDVISSATTPIQYTEPFRLLASFGWPPPHKIAPFPGSDAILSWRHQACQMVVWFLMADPLTGFFGFGDEGPDFTPHPGSEYLAWCCAAAAGNALRMTRVLMQLKVPSPTSALLTQSAMTFAWSSDVGGLQITIGRDGRTYSEIQLKSQMFYAYDAEKKFRAVGGRENQHDVP